MNTVRIVAFLALVAFTAGQIFPSNSTQLFFGSSHSAALTPQTYDYATLPDLYYVYLPESIFNVTLTFTQVTSGPTSCNPLYVLPSAEGFPCSSYNPFSSGSGNAAAFCNRGSYYGFNNPNGTFSVTLNPGTRYGRVGVIEYELVSGGYMYFSVLRNPSYAYTEYATPCAYSIRVDGTFCGNNTVAIGASGNIEDAACTVYSNISINTPNIQYFKPGSYYQNGEDIVLKVVVPENTGNIMVTATGNSSISIYGNNRIAIRQNALTGDCYASSSFNYTSNQYEAAFTCSSVTAGNFFITLYSSDIAYGSIAVSTQVCSPGTAGAFCNDTFVDITRLISNGSVTLNVPTTGGIYGYFDINNNITMNKYFFVFISGNAGYAYFSRGGFPTSSYYAYVSISSTPLYSALELTPLELNSFTPATSNRFYYYIEPCSSSNCMVTISTNSSNIPLPSTTAMLPTMTSARMTTSVPSSTSGALPSTSGVRATTAAPVVAATTAAPVVAATTAAPVVVATSGVRATTAAPAVTTGLPSTTGVRATTAAPAVTTFIRATTARGTTGSTVVPVATTAAASMIVPSILLAALIALFM